MRIRMDFQDGPAWPELFLVIHRGYAVYFVLRYGKESERKELVELLALIKLESK